MSEQSVAPKEDSGTVRSRRLARGIFSSFLSRGVAALVPMVMIPIMLPTLGATTYGAWMTIVSVTAMLTWADLGLGSGLLTRLSAHLSKEDHDSARRDILATYAIVSLVATVLALLALASPHLLSWPRILNTGSASAGDVTAISLVSLLFFCVNMPLSLIQRVQYAAQQIGISNAFTAAGPVVSLVLTIFSAWTAQPSTLVVAAATAGPPLANLAATIWFFGRHRTLIPRARDREGARPFALLALGGLFVLISLFSSLANNSDSMVVAQTLGASRVADYAVAARVMAAMGLVINLVNLPLWPATANALVRGDVAWVRRASRRMALLSGAFVVIGTLAVLAISGPLVDVLSQGLVGHDLLLFASLGGWWAVVAITSPMMMVQNAAGVLLPQLVGWGMFLVISVPMKVLAVSTVGLYAGPLIGAVAYCGTVLPCAMRGYRRSLATASDSPHRDVVRDVGPREA